MSIVKNNKEEMQMKDITNTAVAYYTALGNKNIDKVKKYLHYFLKNL